MKTLTACALSMTFLASGVAHAQASCWVGMGSIQFGVVDSRGNTDTTGTMSVSCNSSSGSAVRVCISLGAPVNSSWNPRYLQGDNGALLAYNIYKDQAFTQIWGAVYSTAGSPLAVDIPMTWGTGQTVVNYYARVPPQPQAPPGTYNTTYRYGSDAAVRAQSYSGSSAPACTDALPIVSNFEFGVWATVQSDCSLSAAPLNFGAVGLALASQPIDAQSSISVTCGQGVAYTLALDAGTSGGASVTDRRMTRDGSGEILRYGLYRDAARTQNWGDSGSDLLNGTGSGSSITHVVYGRMPVQTLPPAGNYRDTITVTLTF